MDVSRQHALDSDGILAIAREVITAAQSANNDRPSSKALLGIAIRLAGSWKSNVTLVKYHPDQDSVRAILNDCSVILRCMIDALFQMRWIADGPNDPDEMGRLYLEFQPVENYKLMNNVLSHDDALSKRMAKSPLRAEGEARIRADYDKVKRNYPKSNGKGVRTHWYPGTLVDLANDLCASEEYTYFVRANNSSVHTGPRAVFQGPPLNARQVEFLCESILMRGLGLIAKHDELVLSDWTTKVIDILSVWPPTLE